MLLSDGTHKVLAFAEMESLPFGATEIHLGASVSDIWDVAFDAEAGNLRQQRIRVTSKGETWKLFCGPAKTSGVTL